MSEIYKNYPKREVKDMAQRPFVLIDAELSSLLISSDLHVYIHIKRRAGGNGECWESIDHMAAEVSMSRNTLKKSIRSLLARNLISKEVRKGFTDVYTLNPPELWKFDPPQKKISEVSGSQNLVGGDGQNLTEGGSNFGRGGGQILTPNKIPLTRSKERDLRRDPITHADPYRADAKKSADADARAEKPVFENLVPKPEPCKDPRVSLLPAEKLASTNNPSRVGEFSGGVVSQSTQNFNDRWNYSSDIAPLTDELIRLYNNGKPDNWAGIVGDSRRARRKIQDMALKYQGTGGKLAELPEMMKKALLWYGGSDFHTKKEFGSGDIFWLCEQERVEIAAAKWAGSGESAKRKVATAILERENGVRHWEDGHVMTDHELGCERRAIPKMRLDHPGLPPLEWVRKNLPEILDKLSSNYPQKEEFSHAYN